MSFRSVDIDRLDPESTVNQVPEVTSSGVSLSDIQQLTPQVKSAVQSGDGAGALQIALSVVPYGSDDTTRDEALNNVLQVLVNTRMSDIDGIVKTLNATQRTVLVKYLYKAMGTPQGKKNGGILLQWAERTFAAAGQGAIIRHITDRRTV